VNTAPTTYAIRVHGHLDDHWAARLDALDLTRDENGTTTITVVVADQAQLHGVLAGLRDMGAVLTELHTTGPPCRPLPSMSRTAEERGPRMASPG